MSESLTTLKTIFLLIHFYVSLNDSYSLLCALVVEICSAGTFDIVPDSF